MIAASRASPFRKIRDVLANSRAATAPRPGYTVRMKTILAPIDFSSGSDAVIAAINASGEAFLSGGSWDGERVMRISVCGWNTSADDVARTVAAAGEALSSLR